MLVHYREQAQRLGLSECSTMSDETVRAREVDAIRRYVERFRAVAGATDVLDVGCGNGLMLAVLAEAYPDLRLTGLDYSPDMVELARGRGLEGVRIERGDARTLQFDDASFDVVYTERCLINVQDREGQAAALRELHRVLRPGGHALLVESFDDAYENLNRARADFELEPIPMPFHNLFFDAEWFAETASRLFEPVAPGALGDETLPPENFLSSHYFISRVVHAALGGRARNSDFVRFFSFLPPIGNYASVQLRALRKAGS